jgi:hypothetical protein
MVQLFVELFLGLIADRLCWSIGAALKKLAGRPLSPDGGQEAWLGYGFLVVLMVVSAGYLYAHHGR